jgi:hypothetical protein
MLADENDRKETGLALRPPHVVQPLAALDTLELLAASVAVQA